MSQRPYLTIVSGLPRSGTSMMMKMLEQGGIPPLIDELREADIDNPKGYYEFEPVKNTKEDPSWIENAAGTVVKMVHLLLLDLPLDREYRVVFMRRDLDEIVRSQNKMLERKGIATDDMPPEILKRIFLQQIDEVQTCLAENQETFRVIEVSYNDLLTGAEPHVQEVSQFLDGLNMDKMLQVVDPALYRNRNATNEAA